MSLSLAFSCVATAVDIGSRPAIWALLAASADGGRGGGLCGSSSRGAADAAWMRVRMRSGFVRPVLAMERRGRWRERWLGAACCPPV